MEAIDERAKPVSRDKQQEESDILNRETTSGVQCDDLGQTDFGSPAYTSVVCVAALEPFGAFSDKRQACFGLR